MTRSVCQPAIDLIVSCEVTSRSVYEKLYDHPTWPGGASGVTIGLGFDLGYETRAELDREWPSLSVAVRDALSPALGIKGTAAREALRSIHGVVIPWDAALTSFKDFTLPRYAAMTIKAFPGSDALPDACFGALVSLVYNRGTRMASHNRDDERREMRDIRALILARDFDDVPEQFRSMKRLWPDSTGVGGLRARREKEAELWESGI